MTGSGFFAYDESMQDPTAVIFLPALLHNCRTLSSLAGVPLIAVVKDDGYGHGAEHVAHALEREVSMFAVATADEGARLRVAGVLRDILVLTPPSCPEDALRAEAYGLVEAAGSFRTLGLCRGRVHLAVNTGMNRYGFHPRELRAACRLAQRRKLSVEGVFSHLYDAADIGVRTAQIATFSACAEEVRRFFPEAIRHLSATGGILAGDAPFDAVRPGIGLYGYAPAGFSCPLTPVMKVYADVLSSGAPFGGGAGYAHAPAGSGAFHTLGVGYGDGFFRKRGLGSVGALCMDACVRQGAAKVGARVCVMEDAAAYAAQYDTTAYEVLVRIGRGVRRVYER